MSKLDDLYLVWLTAFVCDTDDMAYYKKLIHYLYDREYIWDNEFDENLSVYGLELRNEYLDSSKVGKRYYDMYGFEHDYCSVLEMMVYLARTMEDRIMSNDIFGDRTTDWFWGMISNMGLNVYEDSNFDLKKVEKIVDIFLSGRYKNDGTGGLFRVQKCKSGAKMKTIWQQMNEYLTSIAIADGEI